MAPVELNTGTAVRPCSKDTWKSYIRATLDHKYMAAGGTDEESPWVAVPAMRVTGVYGLDDTDPAMTAALRQLAAFADAEHHNAPIA